MIERAVREGTVSVEPGPLSVEEGLGDFTRGLEGRTRVPGDQVQRFLHCSDDELRRQIRVIEEVVQRLAGLLGHEEDDIGELLRSLDPRVFSRDYDWRGLVGRLKKTGHRYNGHKRVALSKYLSYLQNRRDLLRLIRDTRASGRDLGRAISEAGYAPPEGVGARETGAFDTPAGDLQSMASDRYRRIPKRQAVEITLEPGSPVDLVLASYGFRLVRGAELQLMDEYGRTHFLTGVHMTVGRHHSNDVVVSSELREVSRFHLVIDWWGGDRVRLTDLSTLGTFLTPEVFAEARLLD